MTYYQICWYFLVYSFGGWVVEVIFHAVTLGKVINRGFLNGPVCPVYGFGVISVFAMINTLQSSGYQMSDGMIFIFGVILATGKVFGDHMFRVFDRKFLCGKIQNVISSCLWCIGC